HALHSNLLTRHNSSICANTTLPTCSPFFFFTATSTPDISTLSLHDALPIFDDFVRVQTPRKPVQAARAKLAAVGATNLRRNARCPPIRFLSIQRRRRWNQNRLDQVPVAQTEKEFQSGVARSKNARDAELVDAKILSELRSQRPWQITHLLKAVGTLFIKPM